MTIGVIMLAAGLSRRFGEDKRLQALRPGVSLLQQSVANARDSGLCLRVSLRAADHALAENLQAQGVEVLHCMRAEQGMGDTIAESVAALPQSWAAVLIALADMPDVCAATYRSLARQADPTRILVPEYQGQSGHPVCFGARFFSALGELHGDAGARGVIAAHAASVRRVPVDDAGVVQDIDTPAALARRQRRWP